MIDVPQDERIGTNAEGDFNFTPSKALSIFREFAYNMTVNADALRRLAKWAGCYDHENAPRLFKRLEDEIWFAKVLIWRRNIWFTATAGAERAFVGSKVESTGDVKFGTQFWILDFPSEIDDVNDPEARDAHCFYLALLGFDHLTFRDNPGEVRMIVPVLALNKPLYPDQINVDSEDDLLPRLRFMAPIISGEINNNGLAAEFLAAMKFLELPFVSDEETKPPRHERRQHAKTYRHEAPEIRTVILRLAEATPQQEREIREIEWSCHWMVKPHWKMQWYPSEQEHRRIFINAFIKGDLEKPFKPPTDTIHIVSR